MDGWMWHCPRCNRKRPYKRDKIEIHCLKPQGCGEKMRLKKIEVCYMQVKCPKKGCEIFVPVSQIEHDRFEIGDEVHAVCVYCGKIKGKITEKW